MRYPDFAYLLVEIMVWMRRSNRSRTRKRSRPPDVFDIRLLVRDTVAR